MQKEVSFTYLHTKKVIYTELWRHCQWPESRRKMRLCKNRAQVSPSQNGSKWAEFKCQCTSSLYRRWRSTLIKYIRIFATPFFLRLVSHFLIQHCLAKFGKVSYTKKNRHSQQQMCYATFTRLRKKNFLWPLGAINNKVCAPNLYIEFRLC